ncbi:MULTISPECIES: hypothetical protein [Treponema]|uniref:Uncharacterized protein n=1 Tax=Treponema denticola (strain ATCC 35405 / DSM 14222 / CIP 103919 / JCM 8153 / KCTC 15104) TaxID=243275 RepID=Q73ML9_TREDE|nr:MULTISPECIES: hypothetical protein [Treponema]AAS12006.1 hypothetical protein TDE_1489 [Treponema denticola ATCC 35405]EMB20996.1 hypothetical protein HMPREF9724_02133 [Treponema denticola SP37]EMB36992.1 hypothetical protein HMPREF9735_01554 [Treponema denticola ATCC 33521]EMB39409.1 hypothetical protein HMPREF9722_01768 [Treponema denticola ATCC 33520]EMB41535.1 hypothetical protein HMPREF9721_00279 [Treponema denticola ATCC 35404]
MKKILSILVFFTCVSILFSLDVTASITVGNTPFNSNGYTGKIPDFGFKLILNEDLGKNVNGKLAIERHLGIGNIIWGRIAYTTDMINIAIGPTLSVFNAGFDNKNVSTIFQPGLGTSLSFKLPIGFFTSLDTNFSIPLASVKTKNVYLQNGHFDLGWRFPNIIASIKLSQKNKSIVDNPDETHISISDIGFYTVSYSKPSGIRIPLNIIYRVNHFQKTGSLNEKIADIVLETGISHSASSDIEWFVNFGASVFSFSLTNAGSRVKKFFFNAEAGIVLNFN